MPSLNFDAAPTWLQWVLAVAAVAAFIAGAIRAIPPAWKFVSRTVTTINALSALPEDLQKQDEFRRRTEATLAAQDTKINEIHHEVQYNNGSSVKDAIHRVEIGVKGLYDQVDDLKAADARISQEIEDKPPRNPRTPRTRRTEGTTK